MKRIALTHAGSVLALVLAAAGARANPSTVFITENWAPGASRVYATGFSSGNDHYVSFSNENAVTVEAPVNGVLPPADILASNLQTHSTALDLAHADHVSSDYTLSLVLTDNATNATKTLIFHGHLNATFWQNYSSMTNTFGPDASQTVTLGGEQVTVKLDSFTHSSNPNSQNNGSIGGAMLASSGNNNPGSGPGPNNTPEPSTLLLSFLGLSALGARAWWRRRPAPAAEA
jgi:PEP-CTERM motif